MIELSILFTYGAGGAAAAAAVSSEIVISTLIMPQPRMLVTRLRESFIADRYHFALEFVLGSLRSREVLNL
jgi:hypothetical protein